MSEPLLCSEQQMSNEIKMDRSRWMLAAARELVNTARGKVLDVEFTHTHITGKYTTVFPVRLSRAAAFGGATLNKSLVQGNRGDCHLVPSSCGQLKLEEVAFSCCFKLRPVKRPHLHWRLSLKSICYGRT